MGKEFDSIPNLANARKKATHAYVVISDRTEGAGNETRKVTAKELHEMASPYPGIKGHEIGGNVLTGSNSIVYGEDNIIGIPPRTFTCTLESLALLVSGIDVTDDFQIGDVIRVQYGDGTLFAERIVNGSTYDGSDTTITIDVVVSGITTGTLLNHGHGNAVACSGHNNQIKGDSGYAIGLRHTVARGVIGFGVSGVRNKISNSGAVGAGQEGDSHWAGENYLAAGMTVTPGDAKRSQVMLKALTTDATPTSLHTTDGRKLILPTGCSAYFDVHAVASQTGGSAGVVKDTYVTHIAGVVKNIAGNITIIDQTEIYSNGDAAMTGALTIVEDDVNHALDFIATGEVNKHITWTVQVTLVLNIVA